MNRFYDLEKGDTKLCLKSYLSKTKIQCYAHKSEKKKQTKKRWEGIVSFMPVLKEDPPAKSIFYDPSME